MIAALFVLLDGPYSNIPGVDLWDKSRDARLYTGPYPVIAHPPCARWGRYWSGGPSARQRRKLGDDDGCFDAALRAVRKWGGILEHPEASHAWRWFDLVSPPKTGGWIPADYEGGWTCCVEQGNYGHVARKATWLYVNGTTLPSLRWGKSNTSMKLDDGFHNAKERRQSISKKRCERLTHKQRAATPIEFRDLLISLAQTVTNDRSTNRTRNT